MRRRLDAELVRRGLARSRADAAEAIHAGRVTVRGAPAGNPARQVSDGDAIERAGDPPPYVSRGGIKLAAALDHFGIDPSGATWLDAGASTGGFTDCLLQRGAACVHAVDVGRGQLAWALQRDPRVVVHDRTNVRNLEPADLGATVDGCVADLSFISLRSVAPALVRCTRPNADLVLLVKPQFEAGRARVGKGGVIRDRAVHAAVLEEVARRPRAARARDGGRDGVADPRRRRQPRVPVPHPPGGSCGRPRRTRGARRGERHALRRSERRECSLMRAIALVVNPDRRAAVELARRAAKWCADHGVAVQVAASEQAPVPPGAAQVDAAALATGVELIVSIGGDGTMLHTVDLVYPTAVPIVGINAGQLGYLNAFEGSELETALDGIGRGDFEVQERSMVECAVESPHTEACWFGLNEVVLERADSGRLVRLEVAINGVPFTTYAADGVIVSTPTGSTAYSFSVRGPIVSPTGRLLVLTPVSPHMLFDRSLVLAADETIELSVVDRCSVTVFVDGRRCVELGAGARVRCRVAAEPITIVAPREMGFHQILKAKFSLPDR